MTKIDKSDRDIVAILQQDGSVTNQAIAVALDMSEATVRRRRMRLEQDGIIRFAASANPLKLGFESVAIIGVQAHAAKIPKLEAVIRKFSEVHFLGLSTGSYDLMMEVWLRSNVEIAKFKNEKLGSLDGVIRVEVFPLIKLSKYYAWSGGLVGGEDSAEDEDKTST